MIKKSVLFFIFVLGINFSSNWAKANLVKVSGGALPVGASSPFDLSHANEFAFDVLTDGNSETGIKIAGIEGAFDTGAYLVLEFQTDYKVNEIKLEVYLHSFYGVTHTTGYMGCSADLTFSPFWSIRPHNQDIQMLSITFDENEINKMRLPENRFQFFFWSPFMEGIHDQGEQGIEIVEAFMIYQEIPEPTTITLFMLGAFIFRNKCQI